MKKTALALAAALLLLAACGTDDSSSAANGGNGANGAGGMGNGSGVLGRTADGQSITDHVLFETDSPAITSEGQSILAGQAAWLKANEKVSITIEGHADERGTREYNLALGERRATAVKNFLASSGISASRISTTSFGKERPIVMGNDESAWSQNRRAVTVISN